jgi:hypothetical protein
MTDLIDEKEMLKGYNNFIKVRAQMDVANKKYRASEHGKVQSKINHRVWCEKKKDDMEYKKSK